MTGARLCYLQPTFQNPTGAVLAADRRRQVIAVARAAGAFILEDDCARHLGHGGAVPRPLVADDRDGTVISLLSLTKPASPSLRVGAIDRARAGDAAAAGDAPGRRLLRRRGPLQEAAVELLASPAWDRHLRGLADRAARALRRHDRRPGAGSCRDWRVTAVPRGGVHLWVELPGRRRRRRGARPRARRGHPRRPRLLRRRDAGALRAPHVRSAGGPGGDGGRPAPAAAARFASATPAAASVAAAVAALAAMTSWTNRSFSIAGCDSTNG